MSIHVLSNVMRESEALGGQRLVLFVLAEFAHDDGTRAFPDVETLTERTRMSRRQVQRCLRALETEQRIKPTSKTRTGTIVYTVELAPTASDHHARELRAKPLVDGALENPYQTGGETSSPQGGRQNDAPGGDICDAQGRHLRPNGGVISTPDPTPDPSGTPSSSRSSRSDVPNRTSIEVLCDHLAALMLVNDPKAKVAPTSDRWFHDMRLLVNRDRAGDVAEVRRVLDWSQEDAFWRSNVLSPASLRRSFGKMLLAMQRTDSRTQHRGRAGGRFDTAAGLTGGDAA